MTRLTIGRWLLVALAVVGLAFAAPVVSAHGTEPTAEEIAPYDGTTGAAWMEAQMAEHVGPGAVEWMESHMGVTVGETARGMADGDYGHGHHDDGYGHHDHDDGRHGYSDSRHGYSDGRHGDRAHGQGQGC